MILIADSGSTKTHWVLISETGEVKEEQITSGINPFLQSEEDIEDQLSREIIIPKESISQLYFYGAGCTAGKQTSVSRMLEGFFGVNEVKVYSDLLGAAHALCQREEGIIGILGTGSNSGYYDGSLFSEQTPSLGYILGDEGSGGHLGKRFASDLLRGNLPKEIDDAFRAKSELNLVQILGRVYNDIFPNRFLAGFVPFLSENAHHPYIKDLILDCFDQFIKKNLFRYSKINTLPVHFTGGVACAFQDILKEALDAHGLKTGKILREPIEGLIEYYTATT